MSTRLFCILLLVGAISALNWDCPSLVEEYNVVWNSTSVDSRGSMPIGNGDIALVSRIFRIT